MMTSCSDSGGGEGTLEISFPLLQVAACDRVVDWRIIISSNFIHFIFMLLKNVKDFVKSDKMPIWLKDELKNQDQSVETAFGKLVTSSESHSDDVWKFVTPFGSAVIKEALETLAWRRRLD
ncbi:hypothetical protein Tco_0618304 [Tanacetum coccineum]